MKKKKKWYLKHIVKAGKPNTWDCRCYEKDSRRWELQRKTKHLRGIADVTRKIQGDGSFIGKVIL